ncbi:MAG: hypothetical protein AB3N63_10615 [Puniceicoccaceae bacterium]
MLLASLVSTQSLLADTSSWLFPDNPGGYVYTWTPLNESTAHGVTVRNAVGTVDVIWFQGPYDSEYVHGNPAPAGNRLLKQEILNEPSNAYDGYTFWESNIYGIQLANMDPVWFSVDCSLGTANHRFTTPIYAGPQMGWWPLYKVDWGTDIEIPQPPEQFVEWNRVASGYIRGRDFSQEISIPYLSVKLPVPLTVSFYQGEAGDTSNLLFSVEEQSGNPFNGVVTTDFDNYVQEDTISVWARIENSETTMDTEAVELKTVEPEEVELVFWPEKLTAADPGVEIVLRPEFSPVFSGTTGVTLYWGESGDTSDPFFTLAPGGLPVLRLTVPSEERMFWGRFQIGNDYLDTPTSVVSPLPISQPAILDEPDDIAIWNPSNAGRLIGRKIGAVGGNLQFEWFAGESGNTSTPLTHTFSPLWEGNTRYMDVDKPAGVTSVWVRASNSMGSVDSRTVKVLDITQQPDRILRTPIRTRLRQKDLELIDLDPGSWRGFWGLKSGYSLIYLMHEIEGGNWETVYRENFSTSSNGITALTFSSQKLQTAFKSLPSGNYKYVVWFGASFSESAPIELVNEYLDGEVLVTTAAAYPVLPAKSYTNGGIFSALVKCTRVLETGSAQVYAGAIGDRTQPVEFTGDVVGEGSNSPEHIDNKFEWVATGADMYWLEARTEDGELVRSILKYPSDGTAAPSNILLPPGSDIIPIPNLESLPDVTGWKLGDVGGTDVELPLKLNQFTRANIDLALLDENSDTVESLNLEVDNEVPPLILQNSDYAAVNPYDRVIWTADVVGDVTKTEAYTSTDKSSWQLIQEDAFEVNEGFKVPVGAKFLKTVYWRDDMHAEAVYQIEWVEKGFIDAVEATRTAENSLVTERMGTFVDISGYPEVRHSELGWMYVYPLEGGLLFLGETAPGRTDWNWTHPDIFPAIYNFGKQTWLYYWMNGYGWLWDYSAQDWHNVGG